MDLQAILYDPNYTIHGSDAVLMLATGQQHPLTVIDKTTGIDVGDDVHGQTILPAAVVRMVELETLGVNIERLTDKNAKLTMNGLEWNIESYRLRPSLYGEAQGEAYLILGQKKKGANAMTPGVYDFDLVRGSTSPFTVQLKTTDENDVETNLSFDDVRLSVFVDDVLLFPRKTLADDSLEVTDALNAEVTWAPTTEESRLIPLGAVARYELEVRYGASQDVYLMGTITGIGGGNDD